MNRNSWFASGFATSGVAVLSCAASADFIRRYLPLPEYLFGLGIYLGALLLLVSGLIFIHDKASALLEPETDYIPRKITKHKLEELHVFLRKSLGEDILSLKRMKDFHEKNPDIFFGVFEESNALFGGRTKKLCGYYSIAPITAETRVLLERSALRGSDFGPENITEKGHRPAGLYIGGIAARGHGAKGATLQALLSRLQIEAERKSPHVFTRPVTQDGLRLARRNDFKPVIPDIPDPLNVVHYRDFSDEDSQ